MPHKEVLLRGNSLWDEKSSLAKTSRERQGAQLGMEPKEEWAMGAAARLEPGRI